MNVATRQESGGLTRRDVLKAGAVVVGFSFTGLPRAQSATTLAPHTLDLTEVDAFLAIHKDGSAIVYSGKVDLGTGHRIAMRQIVGEELSLPVERIDLVEGDSAFTPNQGPTAGSSGVMSAVWNCARPRPRRARACWRWAARVCKNRWRT